MRTGPPARTGTGALVFQHRVLEGLAVHAETSHIKTAAGREDERSLRVTIVDR